MYKILNQSGESTEILLYSLIQDGITASRLIEALKASPSESITLRINSDGGDVFEAIAIYNYLKDKDVHVEIDGICASAASIVAMSGSSISMGRGAMMMIHNPISFAYGESEDLRAQADILDKITDAIANIYMSRTKLSREEIASLMDASSWMDGAEAVRLGFADNYWTVSLPEDNPASELHTLEATLENDPLRMSYEDGAQAERERIKALDELMTPSRAAIINRAKYETGETAQEIALELLKVEEAPKAASAPKVVAPDLTNFSASAKQEDIIAEMAKYINSRR